MAATFVVSRLLGDRKHSFGPVTEWGMPDTSINAIGSVASILA